MPDPYLEAMMHGPLFSKKPPSAGVKKDKFDLAWEKEIEKQLETFHFEEDYGNNLFETPAMKKAKMREEIKKSLQAPELVSSIASAIETLFTVGQNYLSQEENEDMQKQLNQMQAALEQLNPEMESNEKYQTLLHISDSVMKNILHIAIKKFQEEEYTASFALLSFLVSLDTNNLVYLYRLGISAQRMENYDLAINAYEAVLEQKPEYLGALLFSCHCYLLKKEEDNARARYNKGKEVASREELSPSMTNLLAMLDELLGSK